VEGDARSRSPASSRGVWPSTCPPVRSRWRAGPWRLHGEWWGDACYARDYFDVELSDGGVYRIYRNLADESWYLDGLYD
jgi:hypothetical protein